MFGHLATYEARADLLVASGAAVDRGMLYYQAWLSEHWPPVEVRVADVCLASDDAVLMGALVRGLVMTAAAGGPVSDVPVELLRAATFTASRSGLRAQLVDPRTNRPSPAREVLDGLVAHIADALDAAGDRQLVVDGVARLFAQGNGADRQRAAWGHGERQRSSPWSPYRARPVAAQGLDLTSGNQASVRWEELQELGDDV